MNTPDLSKPASIDIARNEYQEAMTACLVLLDRVRQGGVTGRDSAEITRVITERTQRAIHYHGLLWEKVRTFTDKEPSRAVIVERRAVLEELRLFELEHHQLSARLDKLVRARTERVLNSFSVL